MPVDSVASRGFAHGWRAAFVATLGAQLALTSFAVGMPVMPAQARTELEFEAAAKATRLSKLSQPLPSCPHDKSFSPPGVVVRDGIVTKADLIGEIGGYAGVAGTTGGLGGRLLVVRTTADYDPAREQPIPGSLRNHIDSAKRNNQPAWIVFDPALGPGARVELKATLRPGSNVTVDGSCADITLEAPHDSPTILAYVYGGVQNVVIARLALRKVGYVPERGDPGSAIRVNGNVDRIAILHNDLSECGDGCIDITVSPNQPMPPPVRVTVAYNVFRDHDKVMLFGTYDCPQVNGLNQCSRKDLESSAKLPPALYLTLDGNLFLATGQRHPRAFGRVAAHILNNVIAFQSQRRADGSQGATYGAFVSNGARALIEGNVFLPMTPQYGPPLAAWTVNSRKASHWPTDTEGFVRLGDNALYGGAEAEQDRPAEVPDPGYSYQLEPLAELPLAAAIACVADRAGRSGSQVWNRALCSSRQGPPPSRTR